MEWYKVVKTIHGRKYLYYQKTQRFGRSVKTYNRYIGPYVGQHVGRSERATTLTISFAPTKPKTALVVEKELVQTVFDSLLHHQNISSWECAWDRRKRKSLVSDNTTLEVLGTKLAVAYTHDVKGAWYRPRDDTINLPPKEAFKHGCGNTATERYYRTYCHELIHWTGAASRLNRFAVNTYAHEELVAEAGAMLLMQKLRAGPKVIDVHVDYFRSWLRRTPDQEEALAYAMKEAERAVNYILERTTP